MILFAWIKIKDNFIFLLLINFSIYMQEFLKNNHLVIMAGGVGSRFWPVSTPECPKQFIDVLGTGRSLLQLTVDRFKNAVPMENIWIVTSDRYFNLVREQLPQVKEEQILLEPCMRNTAPCLAYVSWKIKKNNPVANIVVSPADHIVIDTTEFDRIIKQGLEFVEKDNSILTLGIMPNRPETGYGYIKAGDDISVNVPAKVEEFKEKPDLQTATEYIKAGGYYWNAGIFFWNIDTIMNAFREYTPDIAGIFDRLDNYLYTENEQEKVNGLFPECRKISVDYAILENADNVYVLPCSFGWSDLGTWGSLHKQLVHDEQNNAFNGDRIKMIESSNCVVSVHENKNVVIQGLDGYIIAEKDDRLLVCRIEDEQRIKEWV